MNYIILKSLYFNYSYFVNPIFALISFITIFAFILQKYRQKLSY